MLCEDTLRGVRFNLVDAHIHSDKAHRGGAQIIPATRRAMFAAMLTAKPRLMEPVYKVEVQCVQDCLGQVFNVISKKRGEIVERVQQVGSPLCNVKAYLPVNESFGFNSELREETSGQAFPQCFFDHWQPLPGDPLDKTSKARTFVTDIRKRKSLNVEIPALDNFLDKLNQ